MNSLVTVFNALVMLVLCALTAWMAIDERFKTRVVVTGGLGVTSIGSGALGVWMLVGVEPWQFDAFVRSIAVLNAGIVVTVAGYVWRVLHGERQQPRRRCSDWAELDEADRRHVVGGKGGA